jgi:hypothetical protein
VRRRSWVLFSPTVVEQRTILAVFALLLAAGCDDLGQFDGEFRGLVVGAEDTSFVRRGFPAGTEMELEFSPSAARSQPGRVSTSDGTFHNTELRFIAPLEHDALSLYDFPGGRVQNYVFAARTEERIDLPVRDAMVFLSLMHDDTIEVRVVAGAGVEEDGDYFGLFRLDPDG